MNKIDESAAIWNIYRRPGESDEELYARVMEYLREPEEL